MAASASSVDFIVWGFDQTAYGPVELPALVAWVKDERVTADTWIFVGKDNAWQKASQLPELQMFFRSRSPQASSNGNTASPRGIEPRALRRALLRARPVQYG